MIERLDDVLVQSVATTNCIRHKINELVDAINILQCKNVHIESDLQDLMYPKEIKGELGKNMQNEFVEQRKWIGKYCKFWDDNFKTIKYLGILTRIDETAIVPYEADNGFWYCACEPVKPDDDVIYKGGDNE